jgi:hypothetical protein
VRKAGLGRDSGGADVPAVHVRCVRGEDQHMPMRTTTDLAESFRGMPAERTPSVTVGARRGAHVANPFESSAMVSTGTRLVVVGCGANDDKGVLLGIESVRGL